MQLILRATGIIAVLVSVIWWFAEPGFATLYTFITGLVAFLSSFVIPKQETKIETLDQRNRRVMLDHVENFWVKGILEKSLHGAALLELGIKEDPSAVNYPWTIKRESANEAMPVGKSMLEIFKEIGMGRSLLILGAPGSGKTTMLLELTRQLIIRSRQNETEPIPAVFNLASWKENQTLADWLAEQLNMVYYVPKKTSPTWVNENRMLLLLDGLDEVKASSRAKCIDAINKFRKEYGLTSLVVCCRIEEYSLVNTKLSLEGAITLQPLTSKQVNAYFDRYGKSLASVKQLLKKDKVLQELTETPLILSIIALAYKDRKADELTLSGNFEAQRKHLFDTYITRMFERSIPTTNSPFSKQQTLHYIHCLAKIMSKHNVVTYQIEAMQSSWLTNQPQDRMYKMYVGLSGVLIIGLISGLIGALIMGLIGGISGGLFLGLIGGLIGGLISGLIFRLSGGSIHRIMMIDRLKWSWKEVRRGLRVGLFAGLGAALIAGLIIGLIDGLIFGLRGGLFYGLFYGPIGGLIGGLIAGLTSEQVEETSYPGQHLKQTLFSGLFSMLIFGLIGGLIGGLFAGLTELIDWLIFGLRGGPTELIDWLIGGLIVGLFIGLIVGLFVGLARGYLSLIQHYSLRLVMAQNHLLPRQLMAFLEYAVGLIFLRQVGGSYIFIHRLLMEHFAEMDV